MERLQVWKLKTKFLLRNPNFSKQLQVNMHFAIKCLQLIRGLLLEEWVQLLTEQLLFLETVSWLEILCWTSWSMSLIQDGSSDASIYKESGQSEINYCTLGGTSYPSHETESHCAWGCTNISHFCSVLLFNSVKKGREKGSGSTQGARVLVTLVYSRGRQLPFKKLNICSK